MCKNLEKWCRYPESNRDGLLVRRILSPVRLPVPPYLHKLMLNNNYYNIIQHSLSIEKMKFSEKVVIRIKIYSRLVNNNNA